MQKIAWTLLKLARPSTTQTFQQVLVEKKLRGQYALEIGGKQIEAKQCPTEADLKQPVWYLLPLDTAAEIEVDLLQVREERAKLKARADKSDADHQVTKKQLATLTAETAVAVAKVAEEEKKVQKARRTLKLLSRVDVPSLFNGNANNTTTEAESGNPSYVYAQCEVSRVVQLPALPNEDAFIIAAAKGEEVQGEEDATTTKLGGEETKGKDKDKGKDKGKGNKNHIAFAHPFLQRCLLALERVSCGSEGQKIVRVNKLFREPEGLSEDFACTGPDERLPCDFNTLFYLRAKKSSSKTTKETEPSAEEDLLREGVERAASRIMTRKLRADPSGSAQFGLAIVCSSWNVLFVRVSLGEDETMNMPVYVSKVLRLESEEALRVLARFLCCSSPEHFGLPARNVFELLKLPYPYLRALGSGAFADVAAVRDESGQQPRELACKLVRKFNDDNNDRAARMLFREARILEKFGDVASGVPKVVVPWCAAGAEEDNTTTTNNNNDNNDNNDSNDSSSSSNSMLHFLLTSPVGTPLHEHLKSLRGEAERHSFAQKVLEQLRPVLSAAADKGILHGDIKPDNIVVAANGDIFLIDWGCAIDLVELQQKQQKQQQQQQKQHKRKNKKNNNKKQAEEKQEKFRPSNPFWSDELLMGRLPPTPQDDEKALLLTFLAIRESPVAQPPWPHHDPWLSRPEDLLRDRTRWLEEYANLHPELDLEPLISSSGSGSHQLRIKLQ